MLIKLTARYSEQEKKTVELSLGIPAYFFRFVNFQCFLYDNFGKGKYSYLDCFGVPEPASQVYSQESTYDLVMPNRIINHPYCYIVEIKHESNIWYRGQRCFNGNIELLSRHESLQDALESDGFIKIEYPEDAYLY